MNSTAGSGAAGPLRYDVVVVGAGLGGLYAIHRFRKQGLSVLCLEGGGGVGGVWYHNRYPGARVDLESIDYCYYFDTDLYRDWDWSERYATQPEILAYLNHVADRFDLRRHIRLNTWLKQARWDGSRWQIRTDAGEAIEARFVIMATGQLSAARMPDFAGLEDYRGEWVRTSHWPEREVAAKGRRIAVIGTGSSGVQVAPMLAQEAAHLHVFQRTPNYSVPAHNRPVDAELMGSIRTDVQGVRSRLLTHMGGSHIDVAKHPAAHYTPAEIEALLEKKWAVGGHGMNTIFTDQAIDQRVNDIVADFVRNKIRQIVKDPDIAEQLCPFDHPIGTRRLCVDTDYYAMYNRPNVTLVNVRREPIERITPDGIRTAKQDYPFDLIVFALGFDAFTGQLDRADIRNQAGARPHDRWDRGPRTLLGLMTSGFPNLFFPTGPGSPSVLANLFLQNEYHIDWIADCIAWLDRNGHNAIDPTIEAEDAWTAHVAEVSAPILRRHVRNYMAKFNEDGTHVFIPYVAGLNRYVKKADAIAAKGYEGFSFT